MGHTLATPLTSLPRPVGRRLSGHNLDDLCPHGTPVFVLLSLESCLLPVTIPHHYESSDLTPQLKELSDCQRVRLASRRQA
ncbi:hypothetical protein E2C01_067662 [Portunus trituberculatus]|uniref:Uncharacterized protein n=1 Tax=Portunus trituberculatus TaxID=210409 RepID=A0A5B7HXB9_PORTR|nr:hypothetical protein [Portunus trituberculatus]